MHSKKSSRSITSWTRIFAGNSLPDKEEVRHSAFSTDQGAKDDPKRSAAAAESAMTSLSRVRTNPGTPSLNPDDAKIGGGTLTARPASGHAQGSGLASSPDHARKESASLSLGPVEMDNILPSESKPPTMPHTYNNHDAELEGLVDRFGFIYQNTRLKKKDRLAGSFNKKHRLDGVEGLGSRRRGSHGDIDQGPGTKSERSARPSTPASLADDSPKTWTDFLKVSSMSGITRPTELLSSTPSAQAIVTLNTVETSPSGLTTPPRLLNVPTKSQPMTSVLPGAVESKITTAAKVNDHSQDGEQTEPVKLLLQQLTELHDTVQRERSAAWNEFLRRVRAERPTDSQQAPEVDLADNELIGISSLGLPKNRSKYEKFKVLVLSGIPVTLRPKIWAEVSPIRQRRWEDY